MKKDEAESKRQTQVANSSAGALPSAKRAGHRPLVLAAALAALFSVGARSQTQLAMLSGTITDPSGAVVRGVSVTIISQATGLRRSALTDTAGEYRFAGLPTGNYSLRIEKAGFQSQVRELAIGDLSQQTTIRELRNGPAPRA